MLPFTEKWLPTYIWRDLTVLFCGINPGRVSATAGFHYANPANLFWRGLYEGGLTPRQLKPEETACLLDFGYGITDLVSRPTRSSSDLTDADFNTGAEQFVHMVGVYRPRVVCFNGITAFRHAISKRRSLFPWDFNLTVILAQRTGPEAGCSSFPLPAAPTHHLAAKNDWPCFPN